MSELNPNADSGSLEPLISEFAGDPDMDELVEFFTGEMQDRINALRSAWEASDHDQLRGLAHQLKGAAGGYGFPTITETAAELEGAIRAGEAEVSALQEKLEALILLCKRAS